MTWTPLEWCHYHHLVQSRDMKPAEAREEVNRVLAERRKAA